MHPVNERYMEISGDEFPLKCAEYFAGKYFLRAMFAADERAIDGHFKVYAVFSPAGEDRFEILTLKLKEDNLSYKSITPLIPAAHWYEREMHDMFGIFPEGHPDLRPLCMHGMYDKKVYPLRRDVTIDAIKKSTDLLREDNYSYMKMLGQGAYEIPVGPVHAGIIEPGHFRFSAVGETIYHLDPRLFYTHKGTEKLFESRSFDEGVELSERISGVSSFSHSSAYCIAVERMAEIEITPLAKAVRTLLIELERLYNHIGDIGNLCAGTGFAVGYAKGALLKEALMALNNKLTGGRYLRGINVVGGVTRDIFNDADEIISTLDGVKTGFKTFMAFLQDSISHIERMEGAGVLANDIAVKMGATGPAARASGISDDIRRAHPNLAYGSLVFEANTYRKGDVFSRMMVRAAEAECSFSIIDSLLEQRHEGGLTVPAGKYPAGSRALGYVEGPRGSIFYWVMAAGDGRPLRVKVRSASFCNWPLMSYAIHGNIVPDFPLVNKSFNLSYSGCDL
jgi:Ni,Fe-hydrogenase III large subunit/Ni,Fe-hydrogenase III component G